MKLHFSGWRLKEARRSGGGETAAAVCRGEARASSTINRTTIGRDPPADTERKYNYRKESKRPVSLSNFLEGEKSFIPVPAGSGRLPAFEYYTAARLRHNSPLRNKMRQRRPFVSVLRASIGSQPRRRYSYVQSVPFFSVPPLSKR